MKVRFFKLSFFSFGLIASSFVMAADITISNQSDKGADVWVSGVSSREGQWDRHFVFAKAEIEKPIPVKKTGSTSFDLAWIYTADGSFVIGIDDGRQVSLRKGDFTGLYRFVEGFSFDKVSKLNIKVMIDSNGKVSIKE